MDIYNFIIQLAAGFISTLAFSFLFNAPKKSVLVCSVIGAAGWLAYYYVKLISGIIIASNYRCFGFQCFKEIKNAGDYIYLHRYYSIGSGIWNVSHNEKFGY